MRFTIGFLTGLFSLLVLEIIIGTTFLLMSPKPKTQEFQQQFVPYQVHVGDMHDLLQQGAVQQQYDPRRK